jgi:hypothetical protein
MTLKPPLFRTCSPLTLTLPDAMRSSASRLECVALNTLFNRIPSSLLEVLDVEWRDSGILPRILVKELLSRPLIVVVRVWGVVAVKP